MTTTQSGNNENTVDSHQGIQHRRDRVDDREQVLGVDREKIEEKLRQR